MRYDPDGPIVVLSPHLDDAVLSTFVVLTSGDPVQVVNLFAGVPPAGTLSEWDRICGYSDSAEVAETRIREDSRALHSLGHEATYLGFLDSLIRQALGDPDPSLDRLLGEIDAVAPVASLVLGPLAGSDRPNVDHVLARAAAVRLIYEGIPAALYADFPHVCKARGAWPTELVGSGAEDAPGILKASSSPRWTTKAPREVVAIDPLYNATVWVLDESQRDAKLAAMRLYETQFDALDKRLRTKGIVSNPALYGVEVAVPLVAR